MALLYVSHGLGAYMKKTSATSDPAQWLTLYGDNLYRFAVSRVRDGAVAEDLVQETLLAALDARKRFKGQSSEKTWLMSILKHKIVDYFRRQNRERVLEPLGTDDAGLERIFHRNGHWRDIPGRWAANPSDQYETKAFLDVFYRCLAALPERIARIFVLREIDGIKGESLCQAMDITPNNSWVMLYRARMGLRRCLDKQWFQDDARKGSS